MARNTKSSPERGDARTRLLDAARTLIRQNGFAATSVDDLCKAAEVTKGAFFHHFKTKDALGVAAAQAWTKDTTAFFAAAPFHDHDDPLTRVLAYIAFRKAMITEDLVESSCLAGTLAQETYASSPDIRDAAGEAILGHAATLTGDIAAAMAMRGVAGPWTADSLARHTQTVLQGAFVMAKAGNTHTLAWESLDHLDRYFRLVFNLPPEEAAA